MNKIASNRKYYRLTEQGQLPIVVLTNHFSPVLAALLEESQQADCHYHIKRIITKCSFSLKNRSDVHIQTLNPDKFMSSENYLHTLKHLLAEESPEIIALLDYDIHQLGDIPLHFRGRIIHCEWQTVCNGPFWSRLTQPKKNQIYQLRIVFLGANSNEQYPICYANFPHADPPSEAQANSLACQAYTAILDWVGDQRIVLDQGVVYFDGKALAPSGLKYDF